MKKIWWKEAVIYQIYPRSFKDTNNDGIGDLNGITEKLPYLADLGVDVLWLSPIFKSPNDDNGYDISGYCEIMDEFGNMEDFDRMLERAHNLGLKIILDLVVNHSSDEHPWFQASRKSENNPYSDYYIWKKEKPNNWQSFFGGDAWTYDEERQAYYLHLFTKKQPDLNWENPKVRDDVFKLMNFWYDKGIDGFRMDVIPLISKRQDFPANPYHNFDDTIYHIYANGPKLHDYLHEMYKETSSNYDVMTVGECIGVNEKNCMLYVNEDREELNMLYHFEHMSLDSKDGSKYEKKPWSLIQFKEIITKWYHALGDKGWYNVFLDNHDFPRMVSRFGNDKEHRIASAKLLATMLLTLRGTPCLYQGSEIGMTNVAYSKLEDYDDIWARNYIQEERAKGKDDATLLSEMRTGSRDNARTPIQWSNDKYGGFSEATPWIDSNPNHQSINVKQCLEDPNSILQFYKNLLRYRKQNKTLVYGAYEDLAAEHLELFAYKRKDPEYTYLIILNFSNNELVIPIEINNEWSLEIKNYNTEESSKLLQAWEARIYKK